jgi:tetratricopeptide (TPR) repeat protein
LILREKYDEPPRRNLAVSLLNLGKVYYDEGKISESEALFNQARTIFKNVPPDDMTAEDIDNILRCDGNLALIYVDEEKYAEAERYYKGIILVTEKTKGVNHPDLIFYLENYAQLLRITKRPREAAKLDARIRFIRSGMR